MSAGLFAFDVEDYYTWSVDTFGPGARTRAVVDHIKKELKEILDAPHDLEEWADVVILAMDGALRSGATAKELFDTILNKHEKNRRRIWPDWRTADPDKAIEHVRLPEEATPRVSTHRNARLLRELGHDE